MGKSNYTGGNDSSSDSSDEWAGSSVEKGALSRQLQKNAAARDAVNNLQISTGPNYGDDIRNSKSSTSPYEDEPKDPLEAANMRADLSPTGPRASIQNSSSPVATKPVKKPVSVDESLSSDESVVPANLKAYSNRAHANQATDRADAFGQRGLNESGKPIVPNPKLESLKSNFRRLPKFQVTMKTGGEVKAYTTGDGKINLGHGRVSTTSKGKKNSAW